MPDTAVIHSVARTPDAAGGWTEGWSAVDGGTVVCRLDPLGERRGVDVVTRRETLRQVYHLTLPHNAPIAADHRVLINGVTYDVVELSDAHSWNVTRRAVVAAVR